MAGLWSLSAAGAAAAALLLHGQSAIASGCAFRSVTGVACPTCGMTRAMGALVAGHPILAIHLNPLFVVLGASFVLAGLAAPAWVAFRAPVPDRLTTLPGSLRMVLALAFAANWIYLVVAGV